MKMTKIAVLLLAVVFVLGMFASCATTPTTTVKITFFNQNNEAIIKTYEAKISKENPTVLDAVNAVSDAYALDETYANITMNEEGTAVKDVDDCKEDLTPDSNNMIKYWMFLLNEEEPKGDINEIAVADGDNIVFQFVEEVVEE